jgi:hypothetical protein
LSTIGEVQVFRQNYVSGGEGMRLVVVYHNDPSSGFFGDALLDCDVTKVYSSDGGAEIRLTRAELVRPSSSPGSPANIVVSSVNDTAVSVAWTPPSSDGGTSVSEYRIDYDYAPKRKEIQVVTINSTAPTVLGSFCLVYKDTQSTLITADATAGRVESALESVRGRDRLTLLSLSLSPLPPAPMWSPPLRHWATWGPAMCLWTCTPAAWLTPCATLSSACSLSPLPAWTRTWPC